VTIEKNIAVVILSCDKYHDLWDPFFFFFEKHWPKCPYPVYLTTNSKIYERPAVQQIRAGVWGTWSEETYAGLQQVPYDYLIYLQDDYLLVKDVNTDEIDALHRRMMTSKADYLRLFPSPGPDKEYAEDQRLGEIGRQAEYRTSLQCAIWKKETFLQLLKKEENQWEFETNSPARSANFLFLSVKRKPGAIKSHTYPITYFYLTAVHRGKWRWEAARFCKKEGLQLDPGYRKVESFPEMMYRRLYDSLPVFLKKILDFSGSRLKLKGEKS
jgi:hypothetical protein